MLNTIKDWAAPEDTKQTVDTFKYLWKFITGRKRSIRRYKSLWRDSGWPSLRPEKRTKKEHINACKYQVLQGNGECCSVCGRDDTLGRLGAEQLEKGKRRIVKKILGSKGGGER